MSTLLLSSLLFATLSFAGTSADPGAALKAAEQSQVYDEQCAYVLKANAEGVKINPKDKALEACSQASRDICKATKAELGKTENRDKLKNCKGEAVRVAMICSPAGVFSGTTNAFKDSTWGNFSCGGANFASSTIERCHQECTKHFGVSGG
ncbi:MAG: hypothetical protein EOP11_00260 [Proteobacteria bacterium]|nr:MAG: hypothetical protein EOP11_00260 [Pseudomonadota bacterium]